MCNVVLRSFALLTSLTLSYYSATTKNTIAVRSITKDFIDKFLGPFVASAECDNLNRFSLITTAEKLSWQRRSRSLSRRRRLIKSLIVASSF